MTAPPHIPFTASGSYPVRAGNLIRPLIDGEPAFRRIWESVEAARHSVWVTIAFLRLGFGMPNRPPIAARHRSAAKAIAQQRG